MRGSSISVAAGRAGHAAAALFERFPWLGWAGWLVFCLVALARTHPRRFGATFEVYLDYAHKFFAADPIYDPARIDAYLYWPISLVILRPFLSIDLVVAAMIALALSAALLSFASLRLMQALLPKGSKADAVALAGILLLVNIPAAWFNFKQVQAQIAMTAGMMLAAAAMMRPRPVAASLWLFVSAVIKPLSIVMILLCGALRPRMRLTLFACVAAGLLVPFAFVESGYLIEQYRAWITKLSHMSDVKPTEWPYQADFATMLDTVGITLPGTIATAIRLGAAVGTLALAWRISKIGGRTIFPLAVLILSGCYITLFGPRNEFLSFLVLTPALAALAMLLIARDVTDRRAWLLILACLALGFWWSLAIDRALKPAIVTAIYVWLIWLTLQPHRWRNLIADDALPPS